MKSVGGSSPHSGYQITHNLAPSHYLNSIKINNKMVYIQLGPLKKKPRADFNCWVAVRAALCGRPRHRSQRAELPHWAPASGSGGEAVAMERTIGDWLHARLHERRSKGHDHGPGPGWARLGSNQQPPACKFCPGRPPPSVGVPEVRGRAAGGSTRPGLSGTVAVTVCCQSGDAALGGAPQPGHTVGAPGRAALTSQETRMTTQYRHCVMQR
jgi:hypothetical protein